MRPPSDPAIVETVPPARRGSEAFAAVMLTVACLCWGAFFSLAKNWQDAAEDCPDGKLGGKLLASLTLIGIRPALALLVFAAIKPSLYRQPTRREWFIGAELGLFALAGNVFQVWGLAFTTPARCGFFTSLASLWVPLLALVWLGQRVLVATWVGVALGIGGMAVLSLDPGQGWQLNQGDVLTVGGSLVFALFILRLDHLGRTIRPSHLTLGLIGVGGLPALVVGFAVAALGPGVDAWLGWLAGMLVDLGVLRDIALLTLLSTVLATYLLTTFQPRLPASRAALIYLFEPVFAAAMSVIIGHDSLTGRLVLGGGLILGANALAELPLWVRDWGRRAKNGKPGVESPHE